MATRKQIREAFYAELETAADGLVPAADITQEYPESQENLPAIVHDDAYRPIPMHNNSAATGVVLNGDGSVDKYEYSKPMQAQFTVLVLSADELEKEDIYEAVSSHFEEYTLPIADASSIHSDAYRVELLDVNSQDDEDREPIARGDAMTIHLDFERIYERDVDDIEDVQHEVDAGTTDTGDGITDITRTTN
jgi:hypothetical protein